MEKCLATELDFVAEKPLLQLVIEAAGHLCILLPKFHCELNPIEMHWGYAKHRKCICFDLKSSLTQSMQVSASLVMVLSQLQSSLYLSV